MNTATFIAAMALFLAPQFLSAQVLMSGPKEADTLQERLAETPPDSSFDALSQFIATVLDSDEKPVAAATIVRADGWLMSKASEWPEQGRIQLASGVVSDPINLTTNLVNDIVFIQIDAAELSAVALDHDPSTELGHWIVAYKPTVKRWVVGVRSAIDRGSEREGGVIGVIMGRPGKFGVQVRRVFEESGAAEAGIEMGDWLTAINTQPVETPTDVQELIQAHDAGARIDVTVTRDGEEKIYNVLLGHRTVIFDLFNRNQMMSGPTSARRSGFDTIFQHDLPLGREWTGLPLFDLEGRFLGINIARLNRVESFALPTSLIRELVKTLPSPKAP